MKKKLITIIAGICAVALLGGCAGNAVALSNDNITIKKYKGLEVDKVETIAVTDEDVEMSIQSDLETLTIKEEVTERPAQYGDNVIIEYSITVGGEALDDLGGKGQSLKIGEGKISLEFDQAIIGHNVGDSFDVSIPILEQYSEKYTEKTMVASIYVEKIEEELCKKYEILDRPAQEGDTVAIDFVGKLDGVEFDGGADMGATLELGSGTFIPGFEEQVIGHSIGETFDINVTFPEDYQNKELAGKDTVFTITLHAFVKRVTPEVTEEMLAQLGTSAKTLEEYKAQIRANLEVSNKESAEQALISAVWEAVVEQCEVKKFPNGMIDEYVADLKEQYSYVAQMYGMEIEDFFKQKVGMSTEEVAKINATQELAMTLIAEKEGLTLSGKEYEDGVKELAEKYGYEDTEEFVKAYGGKDAMRQALLQEKVGKFLVDNAVQVEPKEDKEK